jgi:hypothetical protein
MNTQPLMFSKNVLQQSKAEQALWQLRQDKQLSPLLY